MKSIPLILLIAVLTVLSAFPVRADSLASLDLQAKMLTVNTGTGLKAFRLKEPTEVRVNGVAGQLDQLQPGMQVTLGFADPNTVNRIAAITVITKPPIGQATSGNVQRRISIKMRVDGRDFIRVRDGKLWIEHKAWSKPTEITVNGRRWRVQWNGDVSDQFINFSPPLAPFGASPVEVKKADGRGSATLKEAPTAGNQQTLTIDVNDGTEGGADEYEVRITW